MSVVPKGVVILTEGQARVARACAEYAWKHLADPKAYALLRALADDLAVLGRPSPDTAEATGITTTMNGCASSVAEVAKRLGLSHRSVTRLANDGRLVHRKVSGVLLIEEQSVVDELERRGAT